MHDPLAFQGSEHFEDAFVLRPQFEDLGRTLGVMEGFLLQVKERQVFGDLSLVLRLLATGPCDGSAF